jgi:endonuclease/exonuclease/phosphatase family metal-dependent hydrolase
MCALAPDAVWGREQAAAVTSTPTCEARAKKAGQITIAWYPGPPDDTDEIDQWCRGVGPPVAVQRAGAHLQIPALDDVVVVTWNAHLAEGQLGALIDSLRAGQLTQGKPVAHFVLLLQELYRRGPDVPEFRGSVRSAFAITARDPSAPDARAYAQHLGLSMVYVPSMRNGAELLEDRGNAIVSTEPLHDVFAHELPLERQRRVAIGASIAVRTGSQTQRLNVLNAHLEPLSSPSSLWVFRNPRRRQVASLLTLLRSSRFEPAAGSIGTVLGGDFNTIQGGVEEEAYSQARTWSQGIVQEDRRNTHHMGRIDYLFFRLARDWGASTTRLEEKFGSDHYPVLGRFTRLAR